MATKKKTTKQRCCRACGAPEKKLVFGYTNLSPFSQICDKCINRLGAGEAKKLWKGEN